MELTSPLSNAPASCPADGVEGEGGTDVQADGLDVVVECGSALQQQHRHVDARHVAQRDVGHVKRHLEGVGAVLVETTQDDGPLGRDWSAGGQADQTVSQTH